jgi:hypothetical protein
MVRFSSFIVVLKVRGIYGEVLLACWSVKVFFDKVDGSYRTGNVGGSGSKVRCDNGSC